MISYVLALLSLIALVIGYLVGRYQAVLLAKIKELEAGKHEPVTKPTITKGAYDVPAPTTSPDKKRGVGIVEAKTPELLEWEKQKAIEKQALGR